MISLFMHGGPSHVDLLDPKPELSKHHGTEYGGDVVFSFVNRASKKLLGSPWKFAKHGECGTEVSELLPETAGIVDDLCVIRSMHTGHNGHEVSIRYFHGGIAGITGRPTLGSWIVYAPGERVAGAARLHGPLRPRRAPGRRREQLVERVHAPAVPGHGPPSQGAADPQPRPAAPASRRACRRRTWRSSTGSIAAISTGTRARPTWRPASRATSWPRPCRPPPRRRSTSPASPTTSGECTASTRTHTREYGTRCLIARRLVERGVRFVQLFLGGQPWDNHNSIKTTLPEICRRTDRPAAALVKDLKQRGLLETTLVHWGGEIGRLPVSEGDLDDKAGRDHNGQGFSIWMAGGGIKGGMTFGATDEVGHRAVEDVVTPNDFQATVLHLLGLDHERLVYHANGREQRLTDGRPARVVGEILESPPTG